MNHDDDIFASAGGSLLNDLLSDLDAAVASSRPDDPNDDILASLERELAFSYANPPPSMGIASASRSAAAFVVGHQTSRAAATLAPPPMSGAGSGGAAASDHLGDPDDAWAAALSQFGNMSLAADFLAADSAKKEKEANVVKSDVGDGGEMLGDLTPDLVANLFEDDDDYDAEEEVVLGAATAGDKDGATIGSEDATGGLMALLGASRANAAAAAAAKKEEKTDQPVKEESKTDASDETKGEKEFISPKGSHGTKAPPPSPMFPPQPPPMGYPMPPPMGGHPVYHGMPQPPHPMMMNHPMMPPPMHMPPPHPMMGMGRGMPPPPMGMHPLMMGPPGHPMHGPPGHPPFHGLPPPHGMHPMSPQGSNIPPSQMQQGAASDKAVKTLFKSKDFPALGEDAKTEDDEEESKEEYSREDEDDMEFISSPVVAKVIFNNPDPSAQPINASHVASSLMPPRDICYIVHSMLRPLQSLDRYNDDYYHWSFVDRKSRNMLMLGGMGPKAIPNPVWKEVKVLAKERETKYREAVESRAKDWAEEKKSLGRTVKTNVNRPKALLTTPVMNKEKVADAQANTGGESKVESDYEIEQQRNRVQMWKARVAIDKGYTAFLSLAELRRLIQSNSGAPQLVNDLMSDVKSNVDLMHASFGISVKMDSDGNRKTEVDKNRLGSTLSLPKGRELCARAIEGGILPHQSACEMLPLALFNIFSRSLPPPRDGAAQPTADGEERLLRALTGLVLTIQPSVEPTVLCRSLDMTISIGSAGNLSHITGSRVRMELLHSILSRGKVVCNDAFSDVWAEKEKTFMQILSKQGGK
mmetsp:Transcript_11027/g.21900  ORF Transcript_11027/g.21900 Transcript_11027/m.21900 type:complete len:811 (-) Transcript_11027:163-2595(-)